MEQSCSWQSITITISITTTITIRIQFRLWLLFRFVLVRWVWWPNNCNVNVVQLLEHKPRTHIRYALIKSGRYVQRHFRLVTNTRQYAVTYHSMVMDRSWRAFFSCLSLAWFGNFDKENAAYPFYLNINALSHSIIDILWRWEERERTWIYVSSFQLRSLSLPM
jgi:hypothetical protein